MIVTRPDGRQIATGCFTNDPKKLARAREMALRLKLPPLSPRNQFPVPYRTLDKQQKQTKEDRFRQLRILAEDLARGC